MASATPALGLLTRTLCPSPAAKHVFHIRVACDDTPQTILVLVSERGFRLFNIGQDGFAKRSAEVSLDSKILDAVVSRSRAPPESATVFEEFLILSLDSSFVSIYRFDVSSSSLIRASLACSAAFPRRSDPLERMGSLLAVDPTGTYVAVGAHERGLMVWRIRHLETDTLQTSATKVSLQPIRLEQIGPGVAVSGYIHLLFFVTDGSATERSEPPPTATLVVISVIRGKQYLSQIHCHAGEPVFVTNEQHHIQHRAALPDLIVTLLAPGRFLLASHHDLSLFDVKASTGNYHARDLSRDDLCKAGLVWTSWSKLDVCESSSRYFLIRSDGFLACFDEDFDEDGQQTLVIGATTRVPGIEGTIPTISANTTTMRQTLTLHGTGTSAGLYDLVFEEAFGTMPTTLSLEKYQTLEDWHPSFDISTTASDKLHENGTLSTNSLFITSSNVTGAGSVVELRPGIEASVVFSLDFDTSVNGKRLWTIHKEDGARSFLLISDPSMRSGLHTTGLLADDAEVSALASTDSVTTYTFDPLSIDVRDPTIFLRGQPPLGFAHVTTTSVIMSYGKDVIQPFQGLDEDETIVMADVLFQETGMAIAIVTVRNGQEDLQHRLLLTEDAISQHKESSRRLDLMTTPTTLCLLSHSEQQVLVIAYLDGSLQLHDLGNKSITTHKFHNTVCEDVLPLQSNHERLSTVACAMRDGTINLLILKPGEGHIMIQSTARIVLGITPVRLVMYNEESMDCKPSVIAICASRLFHITPSPYNVPDEPEIRPILVVDREDPSLTVRNISAAAHLNHDFYLDGVNIHGCLAVVSEGTCMIVNLDTSSGPGIPRSLELRSEPSRMLFSRRLGHLVVAGHSSCKLDGGAGGRLEFVRSNQRKPIKTEDGGFHASIYFEGEKIYSMIEWVHEKDGKKYAFLLVGTGLEDIKGDLQRRTQSRGRIHLLQPKSSRGQIESVTIATSTKFDLPVRAISLYGSNGYICAHGTSLSYYNYSPLQKKWQFICAYSLLSPAVHISTDSPAIYITTATDSIMALQLRGPAPEAHNSTEEANSFSIHLKSTDRSSAVGQHHLTLSSPFPGNSSTLAIMTTKTASLRGLMIPDPGISDTRSASETLFTVSLPASIIRLTKYNTSPLLGRVRNSIVGLTTDGALVGLKLMDAAQWSVLKYVETLCRRSAEICPTAARHLRRAGFAGEEQHGRASALPLGFLGLRRYEAEGTGAYEARTDVEWDEVKGLFPEMDGGSMDVDDDEEGVERDERGRKWKGGWEVAGKVGRGEGWMDEDMHVDGALLARLLEGGTEVARDRLRALLMVERSRRDRVGTFVGENLDRELGMVEETISMVRKSLKAWGFW